MAQKVTQLEYLSQFAACHLFLSNILWQLHLDNNRLFCEKLYKENENESFNRFHLQHVILW